MKSTNDTLQALLDNYLNAHRIDGSIDAHAVLLALVRGEVTGKINADVVLSIIQQLGPRGNGEFISPKMISQFMADLAKITQPKSVLDPVCGSGGMLHQIIDAYKPNVAEGIEINGKNCEIATAMLGGIASIIPGAGTLDPSM